MAVRSDTCRRLAALSVSLSEWCRSFVDSYNTGVAGHISAEGKAIGRPAGAKEGRRRKRSGCVARWERPTERERARARALAGQPEESDEPAAVDTLGDTFPNGGPPGDVGAEVGEPA